MTYPNAHVLLNLSGVHYLEERFSIGFRLGNNFFPQDQVNQQDLCAEYAAAVAGWWDTQGIIGSQAVLDTVKVNQINAAGRYQNQWTNLVELPAGVASDTACVHAPQVSLVVGLTTAVQRGLASKGRVFLPAPLGSYLTSDGRLIASAQTTIGNAMVGLIDIINNVDPGRRVIIASNVREGAENEVTGVTVGRVFDTMRSRRSSIEEARASFTVTAPA